MLFESVSRVAVCSPERAPTGFSIVLVSSPKFKLQKWYHLVRPLKQFSLRNLAIACPCRLRQNFSSWYFVSLKECGEQISLLLKVQN